MKQAGGKSVKRLSRTQGKCLFAVVALAFISLLYCSTAAQQPWSWPAHVVASVSAATTDATRSLHWTRSTGAAVHLPTAGVPGGSRIPALIHQTVKDKMQLSCQQRDAIETWTKKNPGHKYVLWDDVDARALVATHYPELLPTYESLLMPVERADWFRYLVIHKYGGVYADVDVRCMKPVNQWNEAHGHDADVLLGTEFAPPPENDTLPFKQIEQWTFAAVPNHPLLYGVIEVSLHQMANQFLTSMQRGKLVGTREYEDGILARTGPEAWTEALFRYLQPRGWPKTRIRYRDVASKEGFIAAGVRVFPFVAMGTGFTAVRSRKEGRTNITCETLEEAPKMMVCHQYWGSWKTEWDYRVDHSLDKCKAPEPKVLQPEELDPTLLPVLMGTVTPEGTIAAPIAV